MTVVLNGKDITSREDLYAAFAAQLPLPDYCGHTLDALHDVLTELPEPVAAEITAPEALSAALGGGYFRALLEMLQDSCADLTVTNSVQ